MRNLVRYRGWRFSLNRLSRVLAKTGFYKEVHSLKAVKDCLEGGLVHLTHVLGS